MLIDQCFRLQALINLKHPDVLMQLSAYTIGQVFHLYINIIPGQELINHSHQIHTLVFVYMSHLQTKFNQSCDY